MAIITPYGDINAHGSLGGSVSFRRRFGRVIFQKKPDPKQPGTPGQIAQRNLFKSANYDYYGYPTQSKEYYEGRGPQLGMSAKNLYVQQSLKSNLPQYIAVPLKEMLDAQVITTAGQTGASIVTQFVAVRVSPFSSLSVGFIQDNNNIFYPTPPASFPADYFYITWTNADPIPFRYGIWMQWKNWDDSIHEGIVRFLAEPVGSGACYYSSEFSGFRQHPGSTLYATDKF